MDSPELIMVLFERWHEHRHWAESLLCKHLNLSEAIEVLEKANRGKHSIGSTEWMYRTHGRGVDIFKVGNKGGIDFDFNDHAPDEWKLREFMVKQFNDGSLPKKQYRVLVEDKKLWKRTFLLASKMKQALET